MLDNFQASALIIGPTDKTKIFRFGKIFPEEYQSYIQRMGKILAENLPAIYLIPDEGIPLDLARAYKSFNGQRVIGGIPQKGYEILDKNFRFCDSLEQIDGGWTALNTCLSLKNNMMIGFGLSPGTIVEIAYSKYHLKYLKQRIPIFLDERTISQRLPAELEEEVSLTYFNSDGELEKLLFEQIKLLEKGVKHGNVS